MKFNNDRILEMRSQLLVQPSVCVERVKYFTESYRQTEGQPAALRRARAFENLLRKMHVQISPGELVVGKFTSKVRGGSISPELQCDWILDELDILSTREIDPFVPLAEEDKQTLREVVPYWQQRSLRAIWNERLPEEARKYDDLLIGGGAFCGNNQYYGHASADYALLLRLGTEGLCAQIDSKLATTRDEAQRNELAAMKICLEALAAFADRYADLAATLAAEESDPVRRAELERISAICRRVPRKPAADFYEAVQATWFTYLGIMFENWGTGNTFLRADQYLYPFYKKDVEAGRLTDAQAYDLVAMLLINCNGACVVYSEKRSHGFAGNCSGASFTLGGVTPTGECAVNRVSELFLEAERVVNMASDDLVVRVADNTPEAFLLLACDVARDVGGKLKFVGDRTNIANLCIDGLPEEMANDYAFAGCTSPEVGGRAYSVPGGIISLPTILELALNNGVHRLTGVKLGVDTGDMADFTSYDELWQAFCTQMRHVIPFCHAIKDTDKQVFSEFSPSPFQSALSERCIETATDLLDGGTAPYFTFAMSCAGAPNVGDSLAAIRKNVFEEKKLSMAELKAALAANYEGYEHVRALMLRAPKFGNNDESVDAIVRDVLTLASDTVADHKGFKGALSTIAAAAVTANVGLGMCLGATPDGRLAGEPISEGGISPSQGRNTSGITETMLSVAGLDHTKMRHGEVLNIRMDPKSLGDDAKLAKLASMMRTYFNEGGNLVQFNIVGTETLRDAQRHPEKYRDLVVRVATYAAYFIELGLELQNDIINRMEFQTV